MVKMVSLIRNLLANLRSSAAFRAPAALDAVMVAAFLTCSSTELHVDRATRKCKDCRHASGASARTINASLCEHKRIDMRAQTHQESARTVDPDAFLLAGFCSHRGEEVTPSGLIL